MCCEKVFLQQLRDRGLRFTPQRELVLAVMHGLDSHATVDEIYARAHASCPTMDLSTVYRTLELLQELRLVTALDIGDGQRRFELQAPHGPHHHLRCRVCGKLAPIEPCDLDPLLARLGAAHGFAVEPEQLVLTGLCADCQRKIA
jgi:Fur family ferric uptake transcriptional regulator